MTHWGQLVGNSIDRAYRKKEGLEQFQERLEDVLLEGRENTLKAVISPDAGKKGVAEALRRYHVLTATAEPMTWISEMLGASLELVDWEHLAERLHPELKEEEDK